jgi:hypothetical protein
MWWTMLRLFFNLNRIWNKFDMELLESFRFNNKPSIWNVKRETDDAYTFVLNDAVIISKK